jgi:ClpP class serine protease
VKNFLATMLNTPWLIEEDWLANMYMLLNTVNIESLKTAKSLPMDNTRKAEVRGSIAHIPIHGPIFARPNFFTEYLGMGVSLSDFANDFTAVMNDPEITKVVLDVDSPGGTVTGVNEMGNIIKAAQDRKSVTSYIGGTGASAAYWLSCCAEEIVLDATARVGSIGVVVAYPKPDDNDHFVEIVNTASPNKRPNVVTESGRATITAELDSLADVFINTVAKNRGVSAETVISDFGKGGVLVGQAAVDVGMADRLGSFEELMEEDKTSTTVQVPETIMSEKTGDKSMKLEELKAKFPDLYASIVDSTKESMKEELAAKDEEIAGLSKKLTIQETINAENNDRLAALEKRDAIRQAKDVADEAIAIAEDILSASDVPTDFYSKVKAQVPYTKYLEEGALKVEDFTAAFKAEVEDWEKQLAAISPRVLGVGGFSGGTTPPRQQTEGESADTDSLDRMLNYIGAGGE